MSRVSQSFFSYFPPPAFLSPPAAGLALWDRSIKFAALKRRGRHYILSDFGEVVLPEGTIAGGEIKNPDALKKTVFDFQKKHAIREAHVSLPGGQGYVLHINIPPLPKREIRNNLFAEIKQHVPLSEKEALFDYTLSRCCKSQKNELHAAVAVIPTIIASSFLSVLKEARIQPLSFEFNAHSLERALVVPGEQSAVMIVEIGSSSTEVAISQGGALRFSASIAMGGDMLTQAISRYFSLPPENAARLKKHFGLLKDEKGNDLSEALLPPLGALRDEIRRYFLYWHNHLISERDTAQPEKEVRVKKIILCGEEAGLPGFFSFFRSGLKGEILLANPWQNVDLPHEYIPKIPREHALGYAGALGLALRSTALCIHEQR